MSAGKYITFFMLFPLAAAVHGADHGHAAPAASHETGKHAPAAEISPASELPVMGEAPAFRLINQDGEDFDSASLKGKVSLYNFVYTNCETVCPVTSKEFSRIQQQLKEQGLFGDKAVLITISFDADRDKPDVLKEYSAKFNADHSGWYWLTGPEEEIERVVQMGFWVQYKKIGLRGKKSQSDKGHGDHGAMDMGYDFEHPPLSTLTDGDGNLRAVYPLGTDPEEIVKDMRSLIGSSLDPG